MRASLRVGPACQAALQPACPFPTPSAPAIPSPACSPQAPAVRHAAWRRRRCSGRRCCSAAPSICISWFRTSCCASGACECRQVAGAGRWRAGQGGAPSECCVWVGSLKGHAARQASRPDVPYCRQLVPSPLPAPPTPHLPPPPPPPHPCSWAYKLSPHLRNHHVVVFFIVLAEAFRWVPSSLPCPPPLPSPNQKGHVVCHPHSLSF